LSYQGLSKKKERLSPLLFFVLNYLAVLTGYDPQPDRGVKQPQR